MGPPYLVKLIDFAHTKTVPGIGPGEGVLKGVDTVLRLLDGRINMSRPRLCLRRRTFSYASVMTRAWHIAELRTETAIIHVL
ncbi:hypothetical protein LXA43DRAFT_1010937 [Ganoderma leucocontextum]|nr:hypothetical protein LXA43DRAFT_1010937 [Ganoderma leucocontextum]